MIGENAMTVALRKSRGAKHAVPDENAEEVENKDLQEEELQDQDEIAQDQYDEHSVPAMLSKIDSRLCALEKHFKITREE